MNQSIASAGAGSASEIWSGASAPMAPAQKMSNLFDAIDPSGSGTINQSQFDQAFQTMNPPASFQSAGAASVWGKLDPTGSGTVSKQDFVNGMTAMMKQLRGTHQHHRSSAAGAQTLAQGTSLLQALGGGDAASASPATGSGAVGTNLSALA